MNSQYMEDLYNYCCIKTANKTNLSPINIDNKYINKLNDILVSINNSYINKIKAGANNGNNYALIYKGEIPDNIIDNLDKHLCKFFEHFKILIALDVRSVLDILISDYNIYNIYIIWNNDNKELQDNSTNTEEKDEYLTIDEEVDKLVDDNLIYEFEFIDDV